MAHHGDDPSAVPIGAMTGKTLDELRECLKPIPYMDNPRFGATGRHPQGFYNDNDEGEIQFGVAADKKQGKVLLNFGKPVAWIGFDREQAIELANSLRQKADDLLDISKE